MCAHTHIYEAESITSRFHIFISENQEKEIVLSSIEY